MGCGLLSGGVFLSAAFVDLEAVGLADLHLGADERSDELHPAGMLYAAYGAHLDED